MASISEKKIMAKNPQPFILVDGSSYLFRAYYALPPLTNAKGKPTGAIYGVVNMLRKLVADYPSEHVAVVFDPKGKNFRHELYPQYKANRAEMPDDLRVQIEPLHALIQAMGFPLIIEDGVEADDVIGSLAVRAMEKGREVLISTGDKDMAQLVNDKITLINTMNNKIMDTAGVVEKFGVAAERIIDYLTLVGDTSDNIPGVPKVGPKTAVKWLNQFGTLDEIIERADEIKGKVGENLRNHIKDIPLYKTLVTIKLDIAVDKNYEDFKMGEPNKPELLPMLSDLGFKHLLKEFESDAAEVAVEEVSKKHYDTIYDKEHFLRWIKKLTKAKVFAFDTETTDLNAMQAELVGLSFSARAGEAAYVPLNHDYEGAPKQLEQQWVLEQLTPLLQDPNNTIIGQNLKYDLEVLKKYGVEVTAPIYDTLLESYVFNSTANRHDLDTLALKYLGETLISFEDVAGKGVKQVTFNKVAIEKASPYAAEDADMALQLHHKLMPELDGCEPVKKVLTDIEIPLLPILVNMESHGVLINVDMLNAQSAELAKRIDELEQEAHRLAGKEFNLGSPKQLQQILFEERKLPILKKTPKGQPSTAENVLQDLAHDYPLPKIILEYRSLSKLKSTYTDRLPEQVNPGSGRIHTSYNQAVTATGRLSSNNPNLQNIPVRTEEGRKIRKAFIAPSGYKIVAADYSQIELRMIADISKDPGLVNAFMHGLDVHRSTAAEIFAVPLEEVTTEQRRSAKAINFGLLYGMSAFGLSKQLGIERGEAQAYMDTYFARYPKVHQYMEDTCAFAQQHGYVETFLGRRIYTPEINAKNQIRRKAAERAAINAPMQGSAADVIKIAMIHVDRWLRDNNIPATMIMQVHDELVFEVEESAVLHVVSKVKELMESAISLSVPLLVDTGIGDSWDEAH